MRMETVATPPRPRRRNPEPPGRVAMLEKSHRSGRPDGSRRTWQLWLFVFGILFVGTAHTQIMHALRPYSEMIGDGAAVQLNGRVVLKGSGNPQLLPSAQNLWCPASMLKAGAVSQSASHVWSNLHNQILDASYDIIPKSPDLNMTMMGEYRKWIEQLFSFYTASRLRRSVMRPAPPKEVVQLMKLAEEIRTHNAAVSDKEDRRSLRVLVLGGSVTSGVGCSWPEGLGIPKPRHWATPGEKCAWSYFLETFLNHVLFDGEDIAQVDNVSSGGQTSEFGAMMLEYRLYPNPEWPPDVIIASFSANESREPDLNVVMYDYMQSFVKAAQGIQPCNNNSPLLILVDDFYGDLPYRALEQTGNIFKISAWNNVMAVDYSSVVKYKILVEKDVQWEPLLASNFQIHLGIGMHIGLTWALGFNLINSIVNTCNDANIGGESHRLEPSNHLTVAGASNSTAGPGSHDHLNSSLIDMHLLPHLQKEEPPFQQFGRIHEARGSREEVRKEFEQNAIRTKEHCSAVSRNSNSTNKKCSWSWFFNRMAQFDRPHLIKAKMDEVLLQNEGWAAEGFPVRQPRPGWYSHKPNSTFSIKIEGMEVNTKYVVILSMKSYSEKWVGSKLAVSTTVVNSPVVPEQDGNRTLAWDAIGGGGSSDSIFYIDGYHTTQTSVHFPHKIPIPGGGAKAGESLILDAKLVGGSEFKIAGMAFCAF